MPMIEICVDCNRKMVVNQIGQTAIEYTDRSQKVPYRVWKCDSMVCPNCNTKVATRFANKPTEQWEDDFKADVQRAEADSGTIRFY